MKDLEQLAHANNYISLQSLALRINLDLLPVLLLLWRVGRLGLVDLRESLRLF